MGWLKIAMQDCDRLELEWNGFGQMRTVAGLAQIVARNRRRWIREEMDEIGVS